MSENSSFRRICVENTEVIPVRDALGILWSSALLCTEDATAILPLWPQLECGQSHLKNRTFNAEKPPKKAVFQRKVVRVTGFEPAASCSQTRRDTNFAIPGYSISAMIPRRRGKSKIFLSVVIPVVKSAFMPLSTIVKSPANAGVTRLCGVLQCPVPDTATALPKQARYQLRYTRLFSLFIRLVVFSQTTRATNCANPGYSIFLHDTMRRRKKQVFRVCGQCCGQGRFCGGIFRRGISATGYCPKDFRAFTFGGMDRPSILPKQARYQLRYTRI